ncbi:MAG: Lrp/AsnC family transcriptional regulator [archaeon]|nr:Lrp/AsnC family transcriptional regulator [archaeon]
MAIDQIDKKILYCLCHNARLSYSVIAQNAKISRESVKARMEKMKKDRVLLNLTTIMNSPYFGLNFYTVYLNFNRLDTTKAKQLDKFIQKHPSAIWVNRCLGRWDYALLLLAKNSMDIAEIIGGIKSKFKGLVKEIDFDEVLYEYNYTALIGEFFEGTQIGPPRVTKEGSSFYRVLDKESTNYPRDFGKATIDKADARILELLGENCRMSLQKMGKRLSMPIENVRYKMKRMAEKKVIATFWPAINYGMFGFQWYRIRMRTYGIDAETDAKLRRFIVNSKNIFWGTRTLGQNDIHLDVRLRGNKELNEFLEKFNEKFPDLTIDYETIIMTEEPYYNDFAPKIHEVAKN